MLIAETPRLLLRHFRATDADALDALFGDPEVMRFGDGTKTPAQVRQWIARWTDDLYARWGLGMWALVRRHDERVIGYCGLSRFPTRVRADETVSSPRISTS